MTSRPEIKTPNDIEGKELAAAKGTTNYVMSGAEVTIMEKLGHFPMSENPAQFPKYIAPVLEKIRQPR